MPTPPLLPDPQRAYAAPPVRVYRRWTVDLLRVAEARADAGQLELAADLCDSLLSDDRISGLFEQRALALFGLPPRFEAATDDDRAARLAEQLLGGDAFAMVDEPTAAKFLVWGLAFGCAPGSLDWYDAVGKPYTRHGRLCPRLRFRHPRYLRPDLGDGGWWIATRGPRKPASAQPILSAGGLAIDRHEERFTPGDSRWVMFLPYGEDRPWASGAWRSLARWWLLKQYAREDWGLYGEQGKQKFARTDKDVPIEPDARRKLAFDMAAMAADAIIVLPPGVDLGMLEVSANTEQIYNAQVNAANLAAAVRILGHNLSSEVGDTGSYAAAQVGAGVKLELRAFDAESWSTWTHEEVWSEHARVNAGDIELAPWVRYPVQPEADKKIIADELSVTIEALTKLGNVPSYIDLATLLTERGIPYDEEKLRALMAERAITRRTDIYKYHLDYGLLTINEIRGALGFSPVAGGDRPPEPVVQDTGAQQMSDTRQDPVLLAQGGQQEGALERGQDWVDRLADEATSQAQGAVADIVARTLSAIEEARDYADLKSRLLRLAGDKPSPRMEQLVFRALMLAQGRGAVSVVEEAADR